MEPPERRLIRRLRAFLDGEHNQRQFGGHSLWRFIEQMLTEYDQAPSKWEVDEEAALRADNERLALEVSQLARESVQRELQLAELEAEILRLQDQDHQTAGETAESEA